MHDLHLGSYDTLRSTTMTEAPLAWLGVTTDLLTAASILGVGRTTAYRMARTDTFPVPVKRIGHNYRIVVAHLVEFLDLAKETRV